MEFHAPRMILAALLLFLTDRPAAGQELTEAALLQRFVADSAQVRALRAGIQAVRAETRGRALYPNPSVSYAREGAGLAEFFQYEQPLVLTARRRFLAEAATQAETAAARGVEWNIWDLRSDLRLAFYRLLEMQESRAVLQAVLRELAEVVRVLRRREAAGESSRFDLLRVERELVEAELDVTSNEAALAKARGLLAAAGNFVDGLQLRAAGSFGGVRLAPSADALVHRALEVRQDYLALRAELERYRNEKSAAERLRVPDPVVTVGFKRGEGFPSTRHGAVVAVTVPLPLFNRGQSDTARAKAEYERAEGRIETLGRRIGAEVAAAHAVFELRRAAAERYGTRAETSAGDLVRIARVAYEEGEKTILELLDVYRLARQTELRRLEMLAAAKEAAIELERSVGEEVFP